MTDPVSASGPIITSPIVMGGDSPTVETPVVEGNPPPPPAVVDPAVAPVVPESIPVDPTAEPNTSVKATPEWAQKRINELTAKRYEAERSAISEREGRVAAEKANAELLARITNTAPVDPNNPNPVTPAVVTKPELTEEEVERRATVKAAQMSATARFNDACNTVAETGKQEFKDTWDEALKNLGLVGAIGQNVPPDFLETAIELKNPAKILHHLGTNIEEAERIAKLPPKKMAMEMARLESQLNAPIAQPAAPALPAISNAPAPVIPVNGAPKSGAPTIDDPTVALDDWMTVRNKQIADRRLRYQRV